MALFSFVLKCVAFLTSPYEPIPIGSFQILYSFVILFLFNITGSTIKSYSVFGFVFCFI